MSGEERQVREFPLGPIREAAEHWLACPAGQRSSSAPALAATVMLMRGEPLEVFMFERASTMEFAPSTWVFPGGRLDPGDVGMAPESLRLPLEEGAMPLRPAAWAERLGVSEELAVGLVVTALRELFEEAGVLLAVPRGSSDLVPTDDEAWGARRTALEAHELSFTEAVDGLVLRGDLLEAVDRWVTPEFEKRRYDTFFFEALLPAGASAEARTREASQGRWVRPGEMLRLADAGEARLLPPTRVNLERLAEQPSALVALEAARGARFAPTTPVLREGADGPYLEAEVNP